LSVLILELGKGFSFVGSLFPLEVGGQDYRLDLLFYHLLFYTTTYGCFNQ
jgi:predicted nuclease of restriction endonuclease-like (RecB) superfamily